MWTTDPFCRQHLFCAAMSRNIFSEIYSICRFDDRTIRSQRLLESEATVNNHPVTFSCLVVKGLVKPLLIGSDWLNENNAKINYSEEILTSETNGHEVEMSFLPLSSRSNRELEVCTVSHIQGAENTFVELK